MRYSLLLVLAMQSFTVAAQPASTAAAGRRPDRRRAVEMHRSNLDNRPSAQQGGGHLGEAGRPRGFMERLDNQARQMRRVANLARGRRDERRDAQPDRVDRSDIDSARRSDVQPAHGGLGRHSEMRRHALRHRLATIDRMRDEALLNGDLPALDEADHLEREARMHFEMEMRVAPGGSASPPLGDRHHRAPYDPGYGRLTASQARGEAGPLSEMEPREEWGPGYGRLTAAERHRRNKERRAAREAQNETQATSASHPATPSRDEPLPPDALPDMGGATELEFPTLPPADETPRDGAVLTVD